MKYYWKGISMPYNCAMLISKDIYKISLTVIYDLSIKTYKWMRKK